MRFFQPPTYRHNRHNLTGKLHFSNLKSQHIVHLQLLHQTVKRKTKRNNLMINRCSETTMLNFFLVAAYRAAYHVFSAAEAKKEVAGIWARLKNNYTMGLFYLFET